MNTGIEGFSPKKAKSPRVRNLSLSRREGFFFYAGVAEIAQKGLVPGAVSSCFACISYKPYGAIRIKKINRYKFSLLYAPVSITYQP